MVGRHEELRGVGEGRVLGEPARLGVAVGADDRELFDGGVQGAGEGAALGLDGKEPVGVQQAHVVSPVLAARMTGLLIGLVR